MGMKGLAQFDALPMTEPTAISTGLPDAGFYMLGDEDHGQQLTIDAGPLGSGNGGHGHADALSIVLVRNGTSLLIDPGTFEYINRSGERARLRGTGAHNTLQIDAIDQAQSTGPFSWKGQPRVAVEKWITGKEFNLFQATHDGYSPLMHHRCVFHRKGCFWFVRDLVEGAGRHQVDIAWHLGSSLLPANTKEIVFANQLDALALVTAENHGWSQSVRRDHWSPVYGQREWASVVNFGTVVDLPADFATILVASDSSEEDFGRLVRSNDAIPNEVCAFQYSTIAPDDQFDPNHPSAPYFDNIAVRNVEVTVLDNDQPGIVVTQLDKLGNPDESTVTIEGTAVTQKLDSYRLSLAKEPVAGKGKGET